MIAAVDEFILYDDVQFTKNDWRNRNIIKTPKGVEWITVPVGQDIDRRIRDVVIKDTRWHKKHWRTLCQNYRCAAYFDTVAEKLEPLYLQLASYTHLSQVTRALIEFVCDQLGITTKISNSWDYRLLGDKTERLVNLCVQAEATEYISGPAAKAYLEQSLFADHEITITWFDYSCYPEYPQLWGDFRHDVSMLDLLFNCGENAPHYMKHVLSRDNQRRV